MDKTVSWYTMKQVERTIKNLEARNMEGYYVDNTEELLQKLRELIPEGSTVGVGDSMTLFETGVIEFLRRYNVNFLDMFEDGITEEESREIHIKTFSADTFLCSTNALTEDGELYNIDGSGNRVAAMIYGPKQVILVAGINKIVADIEEAENRVRNYAAPLDAKRLDLKTPCTQLGYCADCKSPDRICNDFVIIRGQSAKGRIKVIIVGERLGY